MRRATKTNLTITILRAIKHGATATADVIAAVLESGYGASRWKLERNIRERQKERALRDLDAAERQRFYSLLSKLRHQGFIQRDKKGWDITQLGDTKLIKFKTAPARFLPPTNYQRRTASDLTIIVFDIPESEKYKRAWLRSALRALGFTMLQKSVWIGHVKIPEEFLKDLKTLKLLSCAEILSVKKTGTIVTPTHKN